MRASLVKRLQDLYKKEEAQKILSWAAHRQNDARATKVDRLRDLTGVPRDQVIKVARELQKLELCEFILGRHGKQSRIRWKYSLRSIGSAAAGGSDEVGDIDYSLVEDSEEDEQSKDITHVYQLRPHKTVEIELPADLTKAEAERLATFIQSLPFGS